MFQNSSVFVLAGGINDNKVFRIDVDSDTQTSICKSFSDAVTQLTYGKERIAFDGSYKPDENEYLFIENYQISDDIMNAIRDPLGVDTYKKQASQFPEIKAIFVGERTEKNGSEQFSAAFQRFRKEQYISNKHFNLFYDNNTFFRQKDDGISISDSIDCFYINGELQFGSFYFARQIFDLNGFYRSATDGEVSLFVKNTNVLIEDKESFTAMADSWVRRKIAMINDSKVLEKYSAKEIAQRASDVGVTISTKKNRIVLPCDKKQMKVVLGFLDEEAYRGPFSQTTYLANSKRKLSAD